MQEKFTSETSILFLGSRRTWIVAITGDENHDTLSPLSTVFFWISLSASKWTPPPPPSSGASVFSRMANTSLTDAAALASHPLPHSNAPLSACSTLNAPATTLPLFPSTTFAVMCFPDTNTLKAYLIIIPIPRSPTHGLTQYNLGHSGPRPNTNYKKEQNPIFYYQYQTTNMALAMGIMASTTITLIRPPLTFLSCRSNNNNSSSSVSAASRIFHFRSISAMSTPQGSSDSASTKTVREGIFSFFFYRQIRFY